MLLHPRDGAPVEAEHLQGALVAFCGFVERLAEQPQVSQLLQICCVHAASPMSESGVMTSQ